MTVNPAGGPELVSMVASLLLVVGAIIAFGWLFSRSKMIGSGNSDAIQIVASRALGAKERLVLVEVGKTQVLIGMTPASVQSLHVFDTPPVEARDPQAGIPQGFANRLRTALKEIRR